MKKFWLKKILLGLIIFAAAITAFSAVVMGLWNTILASVLGVKIITFFQAMGILLLCKILFGGFGPRGGFRGRGGKFGNGGGGFERSREMREKWAKMTPEEREVFKNEWRTRCRK
jgi:ABC-type multidrug transport system fused ATPase/permease subunit